MKVRVEEADGSEDDGGNVSGGFLEEFVYGKALGEEMEGVFIGAVAEGGGEVLPVGLVGAMSIGEAVVTGGLEACTMEGGRF